MCYRISLQRHSIHNTRRIPLVCLASALPSFLLLPSCYRLEIRKLSVCKSLPRDSKSASKTQGLQLTQKLKENKIPKTGPAPKSYKKNEHLMRKRFATTTSLSQSLREILPKSIFSYFHFPSLKSNHNSCSKSSAKNQNLSNPPSIH